MARTRTYATDPRPEEPAAAPYRGDMPRNQVSATAVIAAPPEQLFALLTDPAQHPLIDGTDSVLGLQDGGPARLTLGSKFGMNMKIGAPYKVLNTVVEYDQDRLIAWRHFYGHRWRWQLQAGGRRAHRGHRDVRLVNHPDPAFAHAHPLPPAQLAWHGKVPDPAGGYCHRTRAVTPQAATRH